jgi:hypothetical protein
MRPLGRTCETAGRGFATPILDAGDLCTKIVLGTVSERPKVQLSKSCVGVEPTVGSNPTGSARGLLANLSNPIRESKVPKEKATGFPVAFSFSSCSWRYGRSIGVSDLNPRPSFSFRAHENAPSSTPSKLDNRPKAYV